MEMEAVLNQDDIDRFHRDGFLRVRGVFHGAELEMLRAAADEVVRAGLDEADDHHLYAKVDGKKVYFRSERMWQRSEVFKAATVNPWLLAAIGQCTGEPFMPVNDSFVCKTPRSPVPIYWHQDPPYNDPEAWPLTQGVPNFDTDIYLDRSTLENGCVWGIPGHHLVGHVGLEGKSQRQLFEDCGAVPIEMEPGDVLFHSISAPHGSAANRTDSIRRIFYVHYMARYIAENVYGYWKDKSKDRGFNDAGYDLVEAMFAARKQLGLVADLDAAGIGYQRGVGICFHGAPTSPEEPWRPLVKAMSAEEIASRKSLGGSKSGE